MGLTECDVLEFTRSTTTLQPPNLDPPDKIKHRSEPEDRFESIPRGPAWPGAAEIVCTSVF